MRVKFLLLAVLLVKSATTVQSWLITRNQGLGQGCNAIKQCRAGLTCQPFVQKCYHSPRRENEPCSPGYGCASGLKCTICGGCQMSKVQPFSNTDYQKRYNEVAFLVTHNAHAYNPIVKIVFAQNQRRNIRAQLRDGVRGFMLDIYPGTTKTTISLCHGSCYYGRGSLLEVLQEFSDFLENNPREVITFFIEDRLKNNALFTTVLGQANLSKHLLNTKHFGRGTKAWPTLEEMASELGRLVVFSDNKDETSVIAYTYNYVIENNFGNPSQDTNKCAQRSGSNQGPSTRTVALINWFTKIGNPVDPCLNNAQDIKKKLQTCRTEFGRWANFIAVDYYESGRHGGSFKVVQWLNEKL